MFVQALEQISKKIGKSKQIEQGYKILERKIMESPVLKSQFEAFTHLRENSNKIYENSKYNKFLLEFKQKVVTFKVEEIDNEVKALLEYFNINPQSIKSTVMDSAIKLNEKSIKEVVYNTKKTRITERYKHIIKKEDENELRKQFQIINFLSESVSNKTRKAFIKHSLRSLLEERYKNYNNCVKKLYKLRLLTEDVIDGNISDAEISSQWGGGKMVKLKDLSYLKKIEVSVPDMYKKPEKIIVTFYIPIYPIGGIRTAAMTSALYVREQLNRLERIFINTTIYQKDRTNLFDPVGTIWNVGLRMQARVGDKLMAGVEVYLNTNKEGDGTNTWPDFYTAVNQMLQEFNANLPEFMGKYAATLTPDAQRESIKSLKGLKGHDKEAAQKDLVNTALIKKKIGSQDDDEENVRIDDFADAF